MNGTLVSILRDKAGDGSTDFSVEVSQEQLSAMCATVEAAQVFFERLRERAYAIAPGPFVDLDGLLDAVACDPWKSKIEREPESLPEIPSDEWRWLEARGGIEFDTAHPTMAGPAWPRPSGRLR